MGTYFNNTTLDSLWTNLVNRTKTLCGSSAVKNTGIKGIHDALISYTKFKHTTTPVTPGDYMKGIAVCARGVKKRSFKTPDTTTLDTLSTIVANLRLPIVTLDISEYDSDVEISTSIEPYENAKWSVKVTDSSGNTKGTNNSSTDEYSGYSIKNFCTGLQNGATYTITVTATIGDIKISKSKSFTYTYTICEFCGGEHSKYDCPYGTYCTNGTCDTWYDSRESCPTCGGGAGEGDFCPNCGASLYDAGSECDSCPWTPDMVKDWCNECGATVWGYWREDYDGFDVYTCINGHQNNH